MFSRIRIVPILLLGALFFLFGGCFGPDNLIQGLSSPFAWGPCGIVLIVLDVIALVQIVNSGRSTGEKLLWCLIVVFFPFAGLLLYHFIGKK